MIKRRLGEDFLGLIAPSLEIKAVEIVRRDVKGGKRKPRGEYKDRGDRKPREPRE
jgi:hypothetical protein